MSNPANSAHENMQTTNISEAKKDFKHIVFDFISLLKIKLEWVPVSVFLVGK